jgi:hypothetical protein
MNKQEEQTMPLVFGTFKGHMYESERDRDLYEEASLRLGMSVIEISRFVRALVMAESDPIRPTGKRFEFGRKVQSDPFDDFHWMNSEVPAPNDRVDLFQAWDEMQMDDRACVWIMENARTNANVLKVMRNQLAWFRFGAVRWPSENGRKAFDALAELQEASIHSLIAVGRTKRGGGAVTEALEAMVEPAS